MAISLMLLAAWYFLRSRFQPGVPGGNPTLKITILAIFAVFVLGAAHYLDFSQIYSRWEGIVTLQGNEPGVHSRVLARSAAVAMWKNHGIRGVGVGCFRYLFPENVQRYPEIYDHGHLFWEHAHCDWLEVPIEMGLIGDLLILAGMSWWMFFYLRHRILWSVLAVPILLGCLQTTIHAGFDFPFQCPAILTTWCVLLTVAGKWAELDGN